MVRNSFWPQVWDDSYMIMKQFIILNLWSSFVIKQILILSDLVHRG